jgi:hypothetical protein
MSYVRNCESDVFISYAHFDNEPMFEGQRGWVEVFHRALEVRLRQLLGEDPAVWRDLSLAGNDVLQDTLKNKLLKTALLLSVVTPRYLKSRSCLGEIDEFCRGAELTGGLRLQDKARILKVVKTAVPLYEQPSPLQAVLGYEFFALDENKHPKEFRLPPTAGDAFYKACLDTLDDLAYDIKFALDALRASAAQRERAQSAKSERIVYIAETISELRPLSDQLRRELRQRGFVVYPCEPAPPNAQRYREFVAGQLGGATLSVHLLGDLYGTALEGDTRSIVEMQIEEAGRLAQAGALRRVLWMPETLAAEERQRQYVDVLQKTAANEANTELLRTGFENLKTYVLRKLVEDPAAKPSDAPTPAPLTIYLIYDKPDADAVKPLRADLVARGYEVKPSYFDGSEAELRTYHQETLVHCDATVIYYGTAHESWVQCKLIDLRKAFGLGRERPFLANAVIVGAPATADKASFATREAIVIDASQQLTAGALEPFVRLLSPRS